MTRRDVEYRAGVDIGPATQNMRALVAEAGRTGTGIAAGLVPGGAGLSRIAGAATAATAALAAVGAATGIVRETARSVAQIGDEAERAGVSAEAFQELKFAFESLRIPTDVLVDGLKELNLRADEFVDTGKGPGAEAFQQLGFTASQLKTALEDPAELLLTIVRRIQDLDRASQIRVMDEIFGGTAGERFVQIIDEGEAGIREMTARARDLGLVLDQDVIDSAAEIDRRFSEIAQTLDTKVKGAIIGVVDEVLRLRRILSDTPITATDDINNEINRLQGIVDSNTGRNKRANPALTRRINELRSRLQQFELGDIESELGLSPISAVPPRADNEDNDNDGGRARSGRRRTTSTDRFADAAAKIRERTALIEAETSAQAALNPLIDDYGRAIDFTRAKHELLSAAQDAGLEITPELSAQIETLAGAYAGASVEAAKLAESQEGARATVSAFQGEFSSVLKEVRGVRSVSDAVDVLNNSLARLTDRLIDMIAQNLFTRAFSGSQGGGGLLGGVTSLLGGLFGGFRASGGSVQAGRLYAINENGLEGFIPGVSGTVVPADVMKSATQSLKDSLNAVPRANLVSAPAPSSSVVVNIDMNAPGADPAQLNRLTGQVSQLEQTLPQRILQATSQITARNTVIR